MTPLFAELEKIASARPSRTAVRQAGVSTSYGDLIARARSIGLELREAGLSPGDRVAIALPNGVDFIAWLFGAWGAGLGCVLFHPGFRDGELKRCLADSGAKAFVSPGEDGKGELERLAAQGARPACAVVQFSTGSTGRSKPVARSHEGLLSEVRAMTEILAITSEDRILGSAPFFHSYGLVNGVLSALLNGAELHPLRDFLPREALDALVNDAITGFLASPLVLRLMAELDGAEAPPKLRYVICAGAPMPAETARGFAGAFGMNPRQLYGTTETGVISVERGGGDWQGTVGAPIPGVEARIVDGQVSVLSRHGARASELEETRGESRFEGDWFFPGDLGEVLADGRLRLLGRQRGFINVSGNKADPKEIESVLLEHPAIGEAAVVGVPDGDGSERVKAVLVTRSPLTALEVLAHCRSRLADYKCPRQVEFRDSLPRSPLGKVLRKYLLEDK